MNPPYVDNDDENRVFRLEDITKIFVRNFGGKVSVITWPEMSPWVGVPTSEVPKHTEIHITTYEPELIPTVQVIAENGSLILSQSSVDKPKNVLFAVIMVPVGTYFFVEGASLDINISKLKGAVTFHSSGRGMIHVDSATTVSAILKGSLSMRVEKVNGNVEIASTGDSKVYIMGGNVPHMSANFIGDGRMNFSSECEFADMSIVGSTEIWAPNVKNLTQKIIGSGRIFAGTHF